MTRIKTNHFFGQEMPIVAVLTALSSQENCDVDEGAAMSAAAELLRTLYNIIEGSPELNPSNYTEDELIEMNNACNEIYLLLKGANEK